MTEGDPPPDGSHGPHVLVGDVENPVLADDDRRHLTKSLRLRAGDPLTIGDGQGAWMPCVYADIPEPVGRIRMVPKPVDEIGVAFALIKDGRPETVVQKLTEVGVDLIVPFTADRSVVTWEPERAAKKIDRLRKVAAEAVMQCRRAWLPTVTAAATFDEPVIRPGCAMADMAGAPITGDQRLIMVGPEGGWSDRERQADVPKVRVGEPILRAETASIVAGALMIAIRQGLVNLK